MTHEEVLNLLLANACGALTEETVKANGGYQEYYFSLHCAEFVVIAKELENLKYEVKEVNKL